MKIAVPDLISNSYFPAIAAVELGFFEREGLEMELCHVFPVDKCVEAMRDGEFDFVAGSAHSGLAAFPNWQGVKLLASLAQGMYWLLVVRADLEAERGDLEAVKGLYIGAAPFVELGLKRMLAEAGVDIEADKVKIAPVPGAIQPGVSFGVTAAKALGEGKIDAFWANGMGAETAVRGGVGKVLVDIRRGDEPKKAFNYTMPALLTTEALIERDGQAAAAAVRAIVKTQKAIKADVGLATEVGRKLFPDSDAEMIAHVVARDLPYYDAAISEDFVLGMNQFMIDLGWLDDHVPYEQVVATQFSNLWAG
ncbi:MAG: ABC transporter substrate-binding protein [Alphaproteobacteria bacterium]|jgi:ABC-type nitrate/sulfonate/bicarbonate transport system substrate-binding protein|nr:ABC transporter substrate-binding protein [Alphaproteobacteria bacterium]